MTNTFGDRVIELLRRKGLTQRELATAAKITDVSMSRYINGTRTPQAPVVANIANVLDTTADYLLGGDSNGDAETQYCAVQRMIARHSAKWTQEQKNEIIAALVKP